MEVGGKPTTIIFVTLRDKLSSKKVNSAKLKEKRYPPAKPVFISFYRGKATFEKWLLR